MEDNNYRFSVGVLVLAAAVIGVMLVAYFGAVPAFWIERYSVNIKFSRAPKVTVDTPVRKAGVTIGRVSNVVLGADGVVVTLEIDKKYEVKKFEMPTIVSDSLITGDAAIEFLPPTELSLLKRFDGTVGTPRNGHLDPDEVQASQDTITNGYYTDGGEVAKDPQEALATIGPAFERIEGFIATLQETIGGDSGPVRDLAVTAKSTFENINETVSVVKRIGTQVENANIPDAIARGLNLLPDVIKEARATLDQTQKTLRGFETFSASLEGIGKEFEGLGENVREAVENASIAIENIAEITEPVKENSDALVERAKSLLGNLDVLSQDLRRFTTRFNRSNGTISQLIDNPDLYYQTTDTIRRIGAASENIQSLSARLQPIVDDVRIFTNKVSRDPGIIGVRGALSGRPVGAGLR